MKITQALIDRLYKSIHDYSMRIMPDSKSITSSGELSREYVDVTTDDKHYLPLASSAPAGTRRVVRIPDTFAAGITPTIATKNSDMITYSAGETNEFILDGHIAMEVTFVSDGISKWRL